MTTFTQIMFILLAGIIGWQLYNYIRTNPHMFSKDKLGRSMFTLGILALLLIGFVAVCVVFVRHA